MTWVVGSLTEDCLSGRIEADRGFEHITGYSGGDLRPISYIGITHPEDRANNRLLLDQAIATGAAGFDLKKRCIRKDGSIVWVRDQVTLARDQAGKVITCSTSVNEIAADPPARLDYYEDVESILNSIGEAFISIDSDWCVRYANNACEVVLGRPRERIIGRNFWVQFPHAVDTLFEEKYREVMATRMSTSFVSYFPPRAAWYEVRVSAHATGLAMYFTDVTERIAADRLLLQQQASTEAALQKARRIIDATLDMILLFDSRGRIVEAGRSSQSVLRYPPETLVGMRMLDLVHPEDRRRTITHAIQVGAGQPSGDFQNRCLRSDGTVAQISWSASWSAEDKLFVAAGRDASSRMAIEARLQRSQRLEAIGQLTGGIAHDFNNLLTVMLGNAEILMAELSSQPRLQPLAQLIRTAAEKGGELVNYLLAFARRQVLDPELTDLNELLNGMNDLLRRSLGEQIELQVVQAEGLWPCLVDPLQMESAILNLAINGRDAMPAGGRLVIESANVSVAKSMSSAHEDIPPGDYVMAAVTDSGVGMTEAVQKNVFEPFFTTKDVGAGTGLGLSMVYGFAKQSGGHVSIQSAVGRGSTFRIYVPRAFQAVENAVKLDTAEAPGGSEKILLVEDDQMVREHVSRQLRSLGYMVIAAENGPAALEVLEKGSPIDLLFTDIVMPGGMNGRQLADRSRSMRPGLRVLFTSGYPDKVITAEDKRDPNFQLLLKPYRRHELAQQLRKTLSGAQTTGSKV